MNRYFASKIIWICAMMLLIPRSTSTPCDKGCLSCKPRNSSRRLLAAALFQTPRVLQDVIYECRLCDMSLQFYLENGKCVAKSSDSCLLLNVDKTSCLICQKDFFWNEDIGNCQEIPTSKKIDNCFSYDAALNCINCNQDHYFNSSSGQCTSVSSKIVGCLVYKDATNCEFCSLGYSLDRAAADNESLVCKGSDGKIPEAQTEASEGETTVPVVPDPVACKRKSFFECDKCTSNYFLDYNYRHKLDYRVEKNFLDMLAFDLRSKLGIFKGAALTAAMSTSLKTEYDATPFDLGIYNPCIKGLIENCASFETFDKCVKCSDNYYLISDGTCVEQPAAPISNCDQYTSDTVCSLCKNNYYLGPGGATCIEVTDVENCSKYEGVSNKCAQCNSKALFVNTVSNTCDNRTNYPVDKCTTFSALLDECSNCEDGYLLSTTKNSCLQIPAKCMTYSQVNTAVTCTACVDEYYLSGNECIKGSVNSCVVYNQSETNVCSKCDFRFYLNSSNTCTNFSQATDADCIVTGNGDNECIGCKNNKFAVTRPKRCIQIANASSSVGCAAFNNEGNCIECKDHYFGTNCQFKNDDTSIGCTKFSNNSDVVGDSNCILCTQATHFINASKCHSRHNLALKNCSISQLDENECQLCESQASPRHAKKLTTCVASSSLSLEASVTTNCEIYDIDNSKCQVCKNTYYMDGDNGCVQTCPAGKMAVDGIYEEIDKEAMYFGGQCVTIPYYLENCKTIVVQPPKNLVCAECKTGYKFAYDVFLGLGYTSTTTLHNYDIEATALDGKRTFTSYGCQDTSIAQGKKSDNSNMFVMEDCEIFSVNNNILYCSKCVFGKVGIVIKDQFGNKSISSCTANASFDTATKYKSISYAVTTRANPPVVHGLDALYSVHKCTDTAKIVFLIAKLKTTATTSKLVLDVTDIAQKPAYSSALNTSTSYNQTCDVKTKLQGDDVANCILGVIDMEESTDNRHYCVACAPGYKAESFFTNKVYIKKCTLISDCSTGTNSQFANVCESCSNGAWTYSSSSSQVLFDSCTSSSVANCLLNDSINNSLCSVCKKGYFLALDKSKCMNQTEENCLQKGSDFLFGIDPDLYPTTFPRTLTFISSNLGTKRGCEECTSSHIKIAFDKFLCESNVNLLEHSISNCKKPIIDSGNLTCIECQTGFIPKAGSKDCIAETVDASYQNCDLLDSTPTTRTTADGSPIYPCKICDTQYVYSTRNTCDIKKITNCEDHDLTSGKCSKCNEGFLLSFDECVAIPDDEVCVKYDNNKNCVQCKTDYELVVIETGLQDGSGNPVLKSECIVTGLTNHCASGKNKIFYDINTASYKEECTECLAGYTLFEKDGTENGADYSKCYPVPYMDTNCQEYDTKSLMCKTCKTNYYISTKNQINICVAIDPLPNCAEYITNTNTCSKCSTGYFLNANPLECRKNPTGIQNCSKYASQEECSVCVNNYYLSNNACVEVVADNQITDCIAYKSATECQTCSTNKVTTTDGLQCETITENSCLTWTDARNCATCPSGKVLKDQGGNKFCGDFSISNCAVVDTVNLSCTACSPEYYKSGATTCTATTATISNCLVYSSADKCGECDPDFMLNTTKDACSAMSSLNNLPLNNCSTGHEIAVVAEGESDPGYCFECNNGYLKIDGKCKECGVKNCKFCNPSDANDCFVCNSGWFMSEEGKCMSNTGDDEDETPAPPSDISVKISSVMWMVLVIGCLFKMQ